MTYMLMILNNPARDIFVSSNKWLSLLHLLNCTCVFVSVQFANENNLRYYETSAKHPENLDQVKQICLFDRLHMVGF